jgi:hypothetical protein
MPAKSTLQQHWMGMCYGIAKKGGHKKGCPGEKVAKEFAHKPKGGYK